MLSIKCTKQGVDSVAFEMKDSVTGMTCTYEDTSPRALTSWIEANTAVLIERMQHNADFTGALPEA